MITRQQEDIIKKTVEKYEPTMVGIFGSYSRNEQKKGSDLDILIAFNHDLNLIELVGLEQQLTDLLGLKVDLVTLRSVNKNLKPFIFNDLIRII